MTREIMTPEQCREFWRQTAAKMPSEDVGLYLEGMAEDLERILYETELLKDRTDIDEEDRGTADYIYTGLEVWSELIYDAEEEQP